MECIVNEQILILYVDDQVWCHSGHNGDMIMSQLAFVILPLLPNVQNLLLCYTPYVSVVDAVTTDTYGVT